jgi:single-strand DNA-binding protein
MAKGTLNKVQLIGRLGADPEIRYMPSGTGIANMSIATNDGYKDKQTGQFVEQTEWHKVSAFGRTADIIGQYLKKGSLVYVEGRIRTRKWQDQSGQDRYTTEILVNELQLLGGSGGGAGGNQSQNSQPNFSSADSYPEAMMSATSVPQLAESFEGNLDDDIPF